MQCMQPNNKRKNKCSHISVTTCAGPKGSIYDERAGTTFKSNIYTHVYMDVYLAWSMMSVHY